MKTIFLDEHTHLDEPCVATIGFFDGVHRGHQYLIHKVVEKAKQAGMPSVVVTFDQHPRAVLQKDYVPELLTTNEQKFDLLARTAVDCVVVLHFTPTMAALTAQEFMTHILHHQLKVRALFIGYDHQFGYHRREGFADYVRYGQQLGMEVIRNDAYVDNEEGKQVSSSIIRKLIREGELPLANRCLGYPYTLTSNVIGGFQEGRKLGFPTANLDIEQITQLLPAQGVYAVQAQIDKTGAWYRGMTSIGTRPTFHGTSLSIETNLLDNYHANIYQHQLSIAFYKRLREEKCFSGVDDLRQQLMQDAENVNMFFNQLNE